MTQPDTADFYLTAIKNNKERKEKEKHEQKERNRTYKSTHHPCGCRNDAPHSIQCIEYDVDKGFKNRFIEHHPNWYDSDEYFTLNFNTTDELLQCEYVARYKKDTDADKFYQYSLSIDKYSPPMLMAEYNNGTSWWCLGKLRTTDGLNLPKWEPVYKKKD